MEDLLNEGTETEQVVEAAEVTAIAELEKTDISNTGSNSNTIMTVGDGSAQPGHNLTTMTVQLTSPASAGQHDPSPRVKIKIEYPKGWKGSKHFKDGDIKEVAPETANQFIHQGIASVVDQDKAE